MLESASMTRADERTIASARPRRGILLATVSTVVALLVGVLLGGRLLPLHGAPTPQTPAPTSMAGMPGMDPSQPAPPAAASSAAVYVSSARQQLIGVRTGIVEHQHVEGTVRTVGVLAYDETRVAHVHTKVAGWIDRVFIDFVGRRVQRGQPLFTVYSPDLVTAQTDYLVALRARDRLLAASPESREAADALLTAARQRLQRWDVSDAEIAALERSGQASKTVMLASPFDGVVLERNAITGQYLTPDMSAFRIGDLSTVWVLGQLFEYEASRVRPGEPIDVEFPYGQVPGALSTRVDFVYPDIDPQTRRVRFRASVPNKDGRLKPDTYVTLVLHGETIDRLVVPVSAVIDTGARKYALLSLPGGYFEPRDVQVESPIGDYYPVVSGLAEGDRVVTSAQFLIDSETNLMAAMQNMAASMPGMDMGAGKAGPNPSPPAIASSSPMPPMPGMLMPAPAPPPAPTMRSMPGMVGTAPSRGAPHAQPPSPLSPAPQPSPPSVRSSTQPAAMPPMPGMDMPMPSGMDKPSGHHHGGGS
jgi:RND family efflux transporter MFP subunit